MIDKKRDRFARRGARQRTRSRAREQKKELRRAAGAAAAEKTRDRRGGTISAAGAVERGAFVFVKGAPAADEGRGIRQAGRQAGSEPAARGARKEQDGAAWSVCVATSCWLDVGVAPDRCQPLFPCMREAYETAPPADHDDGLVFASECTQQTVVTVVMSLAGGVAPHASLVCVLAGVCWIAFLLWCCWGPGGRHSRTLARSCFACLPGQSRRARDGPELGALWRGSWTSDPATSSFWTTTTTSGEEEEDGERRPLLSEGGSSTNTSAYCSASRTSTSAQPSAAGPADPQRSADRTVAGAAAQKPPDGGGGEACTPPKQQQHTRPRPIPAGRRGRGGVGPARPRPSPFRFVEAANGGARPLGRPLNACHHPVLLHASCGGGDDGPPSSSVVDVAADHEGLRGNVLGAIGTPPCWAPPPPADRPRAPLPRFRMASAFDSSSVTAALSEALAPADEETPNRAATTASLRVTQV